MGLYHAALGYWRRALAARRPARRAGSSALPAAWLLIEWWRGWFLSGFSWLSLGYSQTDTWLAGFAPVLGVYGLSRAAAGGRRRAGWRCCAARRGARIAALVAACCCRGRSARRCARLPGRIRPGAPVASRSCRARSRRMRNGRTSNREHDARRSTAAQRAGARHAPHRLAGGALPQTWPTISCPTSRQLYREAHAHGSALVMGMLRADATSEHALLQLDAGARRQVSLVRQAPPGAVRGVLPGARSSCAPGCACMSLPYSDFTPGPADQPPLPAARLAARRHASATRTPTAARCWTTLPAADALVNVTNDAWFGHSSARYQHLQIARMRALEAGRYLVRAANDGISAVIGPHGEVVARARGIPSRGAGLKNVPRERGLTAVRASWQLADCHTGRRRAGVWTVGAE